MVFHPLNPFFIPLEKKLTHMSMSTFPLSKIQAPDFWTWCGLIRRFEASSKVTQNFFPIKVVSLLYYEWILRIKYSFSSYDAINYALCGCSTAIRCGFNTFWSDKISVFSSRISFYYFLCPLLQHLKDQNNIFQKCCIAIIM